MRVLGSGHAGSSKDRPRRQRVLYRMSKVESEHPAFDPDRSFPDQLSRMIMGGRIAQIIAVAAELGIPDLLKDAPRTGDELAAATSTHAPSLYRLMQALAALGLVRIET